MSAARALLAGLAVAAVASGCIVRYVTGPRITGTCEGACAHYLDCRGDDDGGRIRAACLDECPQVFGDRESLMAFESLSCEQTIEYVEGPNRRPPGAPLPRGQAAERHGR